MALIKKWCLRAESNHRHGDFQSPALPTELQRRFLQRLFSILYSLRNVNNFFQKFLYILQAGENSHRSSACDCFTFLCRFTADLSPQQVRRSILFMREQPHGAAQNSSSETRLLYVCLVIYTVCRRTRCILHQNRKPSEDPRSVQCIVFCRDFPRCSTAPPVKCMPSAVPCVLARSGRPVSRSPTDSTLSASAFPSRRGTPSVHFSLPAHDRRQRPHRLCRQLPQPVRRLIETISCDCSCTPSFPALLSCSYYIDECPSGFVTRSRKNF